jgi:ferredoxin-nitrate reductase
LATSQSGLSAREVHDAVANPWGERTPYARGDEWPVRVDEHLVDEPAFWAQVASVLHSNGDAYDLGVKDGRLVGVRGRAADRVNRGRLGPKDLFGWQAMQSPDRLTQPLVRRTASCGRATGARL